MGMNEDIADLNKRISLMGKKQEEVNKLLAVEEHKIKEITEALDQEGYKVDEMTAHQIEDLIETLTNQFQETRDSIDEKLREVEGLYGQLAEILQKG